MPAFIITGMVRWSRGQDLFVEADDRQIWLLDLPSELVPEADGLLHDRVTVEGGRTRRLTSWTPSRIVQRSQAGVG